MAKQYKVPSLLPVPLIVIMVASVAAPVLAYVMIYQVNTKKLEDLEAQYKQLRTQNEALRKRAETFKDEELAKLNYRLLQKAFQFRFFDDTDQVARFWDEVVLQMSEGKEYSFLETREEGDPVNVSRVSLHPDFREEWVGELRVRGSHRALMQFLIDLYNVRRRIFFPKAACARVDLPEREEPFFKTEQYLQVAAADARAVGQPAEPGFYFEPWNMAKDPPAPLSADEVNATLTSVDAIMPRTGYLWWVGPGMDAEKAANIKARVAPGDPHFAKSVDFILSQMQYFYDPAKADHARPFTNDAGPESPRANICRHTGGNSWPHEMPVFLYLEALQLRSTVNVIKAEHDMIVRVVFPVGWQPRENEDEGGEPVSNN